MRKLLLMYTDTQLSRELVEKLQIVSDYLHSQREALFYVQLSVIDGATTKKNFEELLKSFSVDALFGPLIDLLLADKRIFLLPRVLTYVCALYLEKNNIMHFTVESPIALHADEMSILRSFLEKQQERLYSLLLKRIRSSLQDLRYIVQPSVLSIRSEDSCGYYRLHKEKLWKLKRQI